MRCTRQGLPHSPTPSNSEYFQGRAEGTWCKETKHTHSLVQSFEIPSLWDPPTTTSNFPPSASHLSCGGVPGSPRASSPEFQAWLGSLPIERPCSSGACSSPASRRREGQGNMLPLRGGQGRAAPLWGTLCCPGLLPCPPCPSRAPRQSQPPSAASTTLRDSGSPGHPPTSQGLASTPAPSAFPGHVVRAPAGAPASAPWRRGQGAGPPSGGCERVGGGAEQVTAEPGHDVEATPSPQRMARLSFADTHTHTHLSRNLETFRLLYCT